MCSFKDDKLFIYTNVYGIDNIECYLGRVSG